jgi:hypothetical protein
MARLRPSTLPLRLAALLLVAACDTTGTDPSPPEPFVSLTPGRSWTYAFADPRFGSTFRWEVTARAGDTVWMARSWEGSHAGDIVLLEAPMGLDLLTRDAAAPGSFVRFAPGEAWTHHDPWECDDGAGFVAFAEDEPVTTPAGTFEGTVRVERRTDFPCTDAGTSVEWWAPGVGLVRWEEMNFWAGGPVVVHLTKTTSP